MVLLRLSNPLSYLILLWYKFSLLTSLKFFQCKFDGLSWKLRMWFTLVFDIRSNEMKCLSIEHISHIVKRTKAFSIDCFYRLFLLCFCGFFSPFETGFYLIDHSHFYRDLFDLRRDFAVCNWPQISLSISGKHTIASIFYITGKRAWEYYCFSLEPFSLYLHKYVR